MKTPLITREGYDKLKQELDFLWRQERPESHQKMSPGRRASAIAVKIADYQYNKKRLREIDRRVRYLTKCLENPENCRLLTATGRQSVLRRVGGKIRKMTMATHYVFALSVTTKIF